MIADVLEQVEDVLVGLVGSQATMKSADRPGELQRALDLLTEMPLPHRANQERELIPPLARYGFALRDFGLLVGALALARLATPDATSDASTPHSTRA